MEDNKTEKRDITKSRKAEAALKQSEEKYRRLYNETPVLLHSIDMDGIIVEVNDYWLQTLGYDRSEVIGKKVTDFYTEASRKYFQEVVRPEFLRNGIAKDISYQLIRKNGKLVDVLLSASAERDTAGNIVRSQAVIVDITERKQAEELLLQREARYRMLYEGTPVMLHSIDAEGKLVSVSDHWLSTLGYTRDEVMGRRSTEFLNDESRTYARDVVLPDFMRTGICTDIPYTFIKKNGECICTLLSAIAERDEAGKLIRSLAVIIDITEQKRTEELLRKSEAQFRGLVEESPIAILIVNRSGRIEYINKKHQEIVGYTVEQIPTLDAWWALAYSDAETRQHTMAAWGGLARKILSGENVGPIERTIVCKDGISKDVEMRFSLAGEKIYVVFVDITERKRLEQEIIRTQKLESLGTLAGGIAHDFNNLLQGVFGYISIAKIIHDQKEKSLAMLAQAEEALHLSVNLTTQLLTFSKGGKPLKKLIRLEPTIENAVKFALSGSPTDYQLSMAPDLWAVEADTGQLAQVIQNIVLNANEAMAGRGTVTIAVSNMDIPAKTNMRLPEGGQFVCIEIEDTGTGIPEQNMAKIFDPYFTTKQKGSGLGLATSYSIIKNHGGLIEARSEPNSGTTVTICLPASRTAEVKTELPAFSAAAGTKKLRILLMDDEDLVRSIANQMISALGHAVVSTEDGEKAIDLFRQAREDGSPFDMVILDLTVKGGMGGEETIANIRNIDPNVKAVVSSGYADSPIVANYHAYGFSAVLNKPYRLDALKNCLDHFIS